MWTWDELLALPAEDVTIDTLLENIESAADYALVHCFDGYTTRRGWHTGTTTSPGA